MQGQLGTVAVTIHRIPKKEYCGVVVLSRIAEGSWTGKCSKCGADFQMHRDARFDGQVRAMRN